jgi:hypothetical protein
MTGIARAVLLTILAMTMLLAALMPGAARAGGSRTAGGNLVPVTDDKGTCASLKPYTTNIAIDLIQADPVFDNSNNGDNLKGGAEQVRTQWLETGMLKDLWAVNDLATAGLAFAGMDTIYNFEVGNVPVDKYGVYYCDFFRTVSVQLLYRSMVKIPKNITSPSCAYEVISAHEEMVLDANKSALEVYVGRLRNDMPGIVAQMEAGYIGKVDLELHAAQMKQKMQEAVEVYLKDTLSAKMKQASAAVNTPEEYAALAAALDDCKRKAAAPPQGK